LNGTLGQNADPLNFQENAEPGSGNQIILNVLENNSIELLGVENADILIDQGTLQAVDDFEMSPQTLNVARGQVGVVGKPLVSISNSLNIEIENLTLSESG
jgi:hypothetical protein